MAEKKGFFRKIFSFGSDNEAQRTPESGGMPRASDTEIGRADARDPEARPVAAAHAGADTEAGASSEDGGGITPLKSREETGAAESGPPSTSDTAQKKTMNPSSRSMGS